MTLPKAALLLLSTILNSRHPERREGVPYSPAVAPVSSENTPLSANGATYLSVGQRPTDSAFHAPTQTPPPRPDSTWQTLAFHFARSGVIPDRYTISLQTDGLGMYWEGPPDYNTEEAVGPRSISVSPANLTKLAASLATVHSGKCETHEKHIAKTGDKTIVYTGRDTSFQCTFNYSDDEVLNNTVSTFLALAETLQIGTHLEQKHRFDRLGLDAEMDSLVHEANEKRAIELQNIAPTLRSIAEDDRVIDRVRRAAARLLSNAGDTPAEQP